MTDYQLPITNNHGMTELLAPFLWVAASLPILLLMQRWIHSRLHGVAYLLTGNRNWAVALYAITLFPGVLLHELSHWLAARLLGVRTGSFSLLPKVKRDGSIQLGYVEYYRSQNLGSTRESVIGAAPLITGTAVVVLIGLYIFDLPTFLTTIAAGDLDRLVFALVQLARTADFFVWLYLIFAVSNAMMPSASDRRAWPAFLTLLALVMAALWLLGLQDILVAGFLGPLAALFGYLGLAFSLTIGVNLVFMAVLALLEQLLAWIKGVRVVYGRRE
jgi:hypothetical protein